MAPPILTLSGISLTFGGTPLLKGAELMISKGERLCLVGRNGSGKSTLLKIAAGLIDFDAGTRFLQPGTTIRYLAQEPALSAYASTLAYVEGGLAPGDDPYRARQCPSSRISSWPHPHIAGYGIRRYRPLCAAA